MHQCTHLLCVLPWMARRHPALECASADDVASQCPGSSWHGASHAFHAPLGLAGPPYLYGAASGLSTSPAHNPHDSWTQGLWTCCPCAIFQCQPPQQLAEGRKAGVCHPKVQCRQKVVARERLRCKSSVINPNPGSRRSRWAYWTRAACTTACWRRRGTCGARARATHSSLWTGRCWCAS